MGPEYYMVFVSGHPEGRPLGVPRNLLRFPRPNDWMGCTAYPAGGNTPSGRQEEVSATCSSGPATRTVPLGAGPGPPRRGRDIPALGDGRTPPGPA